LERQVFSAITGIEMDEERMDRCAQRIFNIQRADQIKDGRKGREDDSLEAFHFTMGLKRDFGNEKCIVPGKDGEIFSRRGMVMDRDDFEKMKYEYYGLRGWDVATGLPTRKALERVDLKEVADGLEKIGKLAGTG
jgi:aldehyde:ferredoxin oxidoreductase